MDGVNYHLEDDVPTNLITGVSKFRRKQGITSLKRSLIMKKIWEKRRQGNHPDRTNKRQARIYQPRPSRTRDRVRKELLKPPKTPRPWDLPIDGPIKVQPMVSPDQTENDMANEEGGETGIFE